MPRATENDPLPYESQAAAIARRIAEMKRHDWRLRLGKIGAIALVIAVFWLLWSSIPAHATEYLKPGMIIRFTKSTIACTSRESLHSITLHGLRGEEAETNAMDAKNGGPCAMMPPTARFRVLAVEYNIQDPDFGIVKFLGENVASGYYGLWAITLGAQEQK